MLTIWGRATSSNVQSVMWCVEELGLAHERIDAGGGFGGLDAPEFRAMNPNGLIPVMRDGDLILWESNAIIRYLAARYGDAAFWPGDPVARAPIDQWMDWVKTSVYPAFVSGLFWSLWRTPEDEQDAAAIAGHLARTMAVMRIADAQLAEAPYFCGVAPTPADIAFGALLYRYYTLPIERPDLPHLRRYHAALCERPAYERSVMIPYDSLKAVRRS